jgi:uncharacterized protein with PIN domain
MSRDHEKVALFRFYEELNDFLPRENRKTEFQYRFSGRPSIKDAIEAIGVPHTEIEIIVVNKESVGFDYHLDNGDRVGVYPVFESLDVTPLLRLRGEPLRDTRFVVDVHLGKLARLLRMLGFDTAYKRDFDDKELVKLAVEENRIVLTRDRGLLKTSAVTHGYCVRSEDPLRQAREIVRRFDLSSNVKPFHRCMVCNGRLVVADKNDVLDRLPLKTAKYFGEFSQCERCGKVYWKGSHFEHMKTSVQDILD